MRCDIIELESKTTESSGAADRAFCFSMPKPARKPNGHKAPGGNANGAGRQPSPPADVTATVAGSPLARAASAVEQAAPEIVKALIEEAKQGSYLHAKFLFDFARLLPPTLETAEDSLATRLLRMLETEECRAHLPEPPRGINRE